MEKAERTALARRVGRMTYEQVHLLFEGVSRQRQERWKEVCPDCKYFGWEKWEYCERYHAIPPRSNVIFLSPGEKASPDLRQEHLQTCPNCKFIQFVHEECYSYCPRCEEINELYHLYSRRLSQIQANTSRMAFKQANGRLPENALELAIWQDQQEVQA